VDGKIEPNVARVAIDAIKWTASKLKPKKYGERTYAETRLEVDDLCSMTDAELRAILEAERVLGGGRMH